MWLSKWIDTTKLQPRTCLYFGSSGDLQSTDSENEPDLNLMTEKERKEYLAKKAKRKAEREKKRKEKYGDKYEEMKQKHEQ